MINESLDLNNLKKHSKLIEPKESYLLIVTARLVAVLVIIATIYTLILYFVTFDIACLAVFAVFVMGDIASLIQLISLARSNKKNNELARTETLNFYSKYKLFFQEYRLDISLLSNIYEISSSNLDKSICENHIISYRMGLLKSRIHLRLNEIEARERLLIIFNTLDDIIAILSEGALEYDYLMDKMKNDLTEFLLIIRPIYNLIRKEKGKINYPKSESLVFLDKVYLLCYINNKGGKSHGKETE